MLWDPLFSICTFSSCRMRFASRSIFLCCAWPGPAWTRSTRLKICVSVVSFDTWMLSRKFGAARSSCCYSRPERAGPAPRQTRHFTPLPTPHHPRPPTIAPLSFHPDGLLIWLAGVYLINQSPWKSRPISSRGARIKYWFYYRRLWCHRCFARCS